MSEKVDNREKAIMGFIAKNPGASVYGIYEGLKKAKKVDIGNRIFVLRRIKMLARKGFLHVEKGPRNANPSWLTIKGLIYTVQQGAIEPKNAQDIEKMHNLDIPCKFHCGRPFANPKADCDWVKSFKSRYPEVFFKILAHMPNIIESQEENRSQFSCLSAILGSIYLFLSDLEYHEQCLKAQDLEAGCHGIAIDPDDESTVNPFVSPIAETIFKVLGIDVSSRLRQA